jgi:transglutaminase-like putative cysteine protease
MFEVEAVSLAQLDLTVLHYLYPSRYCQSDQMGRIASKHFGHITHPLGRASAVSDWIFENIDYVSGTTDTGTSAYDTVTQRAGVCRDFAHLGIALCRALSIPARYFTGYACGMQPPDFHACFEVCVGNQWYVFDPTRLSAPNGLIQIATGRDAADSAVASIYGAVQLEWMSVSCTAESFQPIPHEAMAGKALLVEP